MSESQGTMPRTPYEQRFWQRIDQQPGDDGCWIIRSLFNPGAYAFVTVNGKSKLAHQFAWELENGRPVPKGMVLRHKCDTPRCVRPSHLILGTRRENYEDMVARGRVACGERGGGAYLTEENVMEIRTKYASEPISGADLAKQFGVSEGTIWLVINGKSWKHLPLVPNDPSVKRRRGGPKPSSTWAPSVRLAVTQVIERTSTRGVPTREIGRSLDVCESIIRRVLTGQRQSDVLIENMIKRGWIRVDDGELTWVLTSPLGP